MGVRSPESLHFPFVDMRKSWHFVVLSGRHLWYLVKSGRNHTGQIVMGEVDRVQRVSQVYVRHYRSLDSGDVLVDCLREAVKIPDLRLSIGHWHVLVSTESVQ